MLLETRSVEKPWGRDALPPPFAAPTGQRIGEIWFVPPPELDTLLVKYIFTSENLSVQVHPSDAQVPGEGKEECWLVIDAEPGAKLGIGLTHEVGAEDLRAAALDGSIEGLLEWHTVAPGDFFRIPAGTIHAIGGGVSLVEIQQNSDTTYRLYDYGRPRELHLEQAVSVAQCGPYARAHHRTVCDGESGTLVEGPRFTLDVVDGAPGDDAVAKYDTSSLVIPLNGTVALGDSGVAPGQCALVPRLVGVTAAEGTCWLVARPNG